MPEPVIEFCLLGWSDCGICFGANQNACRLDDVGELQSSYGFNDSDELHDKKTSHALLCLDRANDSLLRAFLRGTGRIAATSLGLAGNSGMSSSFYYLLANGESRHRLVVSPDEYRAYMENLAVIRGVRRNTICDGGPFMTYAVGFDNRLLLPPMMPVLRDNDGMFGTMLPLLVPDAFIGHLPYAITHSPPSHRGSSLQSIRSTPAGSNAIMMISMITMSFPLTAMPGGTEADRSLALGHYLQSISRLKVQEFMEFLMPRYVREKARQIGELERLLNLYNGQPQAWAEDVQGSIDAIYTSLQTRASLFPRDLCLGRTPDEATALLLELIGRYGELLEYWPDVVMEAKNLRGRGIRLAGPV